MGNTCKSMANSCQYMTKPLQYCKVISLQLIKINEKKIKEAGCPIYAFEFWCWRRLLRVPWKIKAVNPKWNQPWIFIGRTDSEAEAPILWPHVAKGRLIGKDPDVGKDWGQEEKGVTEDEMVGWHHQLNWHEIEQTQGDCEGQGNLECFSAWGHKELDMTERLNKNKPRRLNQDGGIEGRVLISSCESTESATSYWTIIHRRMLKSTKKDTPLPKTKEKPQQDGRRGEIMVKLSPRPAGWATHKLENNNT